MDKGVVEDDDMGEEGMHCNNHPYNRNNPGGICAFCLQDKLGKLVSSSSTTSTTTTTTIHKSSTSFRHKSNDNGNGSSSSTSSPNSFRDPPPPLSLSLSLSLSLNPPNNNHRPKNIDQITFSSKNNQRKMEQPSPYINMALKRSKSTAATTNMRRFNEVYSPRIKKGFWSFLHLHSKKKSNHISNMDPSVHPTNSTSSCSHAASVKGETPSSTKDEDQDDNSPNSSHASSSSFGRKVARSRSVGCGNRSFSGDFLERISTGFGDCTLRRVESQREGNSGNKVVHHHYRIKEERVKCGGLFGGFSMISSSTYWASEEVSTSSSMGQRRISGTLMSGIAPPLPHGSRSKSWGWSLASPMRAFRPTKPKEDKGEDEKTTAIANGKKITITSNLASIPSLLTTTSNASGSNTKETCNQSSVCHS